MFKKVYSITSTIKKIFSTSRDIFKDFLKMSFTEKFFITYVGCWISFLSVVALSKTLIFFSSQLTPSHSESVIKTVEYVATKKFEVVSSSVSTHVDYSYLSLVLSYFVNNSISCIVILLAYILVAYLYRKEVERDPGALEDYINALMLFYLVTVINPFTGLLGYKIDIEHLPVVVPHGLFEFAGLSLSIVTGLTIAERILSIEYSKSNIGIKRIFSKDVILKIFIALVLIGLAAFLEPIDWMVYQYSIYHNLNIVEVLVKTYINILKILLTSFLS